jgi:hypothetical protein
MLIMACVLLASTRRAMQVLVSAFPWCACCTRWCPTSLTSELLTATRLVVKKLCGGAAGLPQMEAAIVAVERWASNILCSKVRIGWAASIVPMVLIVALTVLSCYSSAPSGKVSIQLQS